MAFILSKDFSWQSHEGYDHVEFTSKWVAYREYLRGLKGKVPASTYEFANADWHYDTGDARCLHDAWLEEVKFGEVNEEEGRFSPRAFDIHVTLLGAYHNGRIELAYRTIYQYSFNLKRRSILPEHSIQSSYHCDWLTDEVRLGDDGHIIHEIEWDSAHWQIECADIEYSWLPFDPDAPTLMTV